LVGYEINGDGNDENNYATGSKSNDNSNSLRLAEIKCSKYNFIIKIKTY